jgi:protein SCO1/2
MSAEAGQLSDSALRQIRFDQKIGAQIPLEATFRDESGRSVRLADYFGKKPVVLVLGYYGCPMLCTLVSNGLIESFHDLKANIGDQFDVIHVSVSPGEKPSLAAAKKREYRPITNRYGALVLDCVRVIAVATLLVLVIGITRSVRGERKLRS